MPQFAGGPARWHSSRPPACRPSRAAQAQLRHAVFLGLACGMWALMWDVRWGPYASTPDKDDRFWVFFRVGGWVGSWVGGFCCAVLCCAVATLVPRYRLVGPYCVAQLPALTPLACPPSPTAAGPAVPHAAAHRHPADPLPVLAGGHQAQTHQPPPAHAGAVEAGALGVGGPPRVESARGKLRTLVLLPTALPAHPSPGPRCGPCRRRCCSCC